MVRFIVSKEMYKNNNPTGNVVVVSNTAHKSVVEAVNEMKLCASSNINYAGYRTTKDRRDPDSNHLLIVDSINQLIICKYMVMRCTF